MPSRRERVVYRVRTREGGKEGKGQEGGAGAGARLARPEVGIGMPPHRRAREGGGIGRSQEDGIMIPLLPRVRNGIHHHYPTRPRLRRFDAADPARHHLPLRARVHLPAPLHPARANASAGPLRQCLAGAEHREKCRGRLYQGVGLLIHARPCARARARPSLGPVLRPAGKGHRPIPAHHHHAGGG